jgi:polyhydroxybutyrate depolymerase
MHSRLSIKLWSKLIQLLACFATTASSAGTLVERTLNHDAISRRYLEYTPDNLPATAVPVMLVLHGGGESADSASAPTRPTGHWRLIADRDGLVVLYPDSSNGNWNDCGQIALTGNPSQADDVGFLAKMLDELAARRAIDSQQVFVSGVSNGGLMGFRLLLEQSERYAGLGASIALLPVDSVGECRAAPTNPSVAVLQVGTVDPLIPFNGGARNQSYAATRDQLLTWFGCQRVPTISNFPDLNMTDGSTVQAIDYGCPRDAGQADADFTAIIATGAGHVPPSVLYPLPGQQNRDIEIAEEIWLRLKTVRLGIDRYFSAGFE